MIYSVDKKILGPYIPFELMGICKKTFRDGDTLIAKVLGSRGFYEPLELRWFGIQAPETRGKERPFGLSAREYAIELTEGYHLSYQPIVLSNERGAPLTSYNSLPIRFKKGKYGRTPALIYRFEDLIKEDGFPTSVNQMMVNAGHAILKDYDRKAKNPKTVMDIYNAVSSKPIELIQKRIKLNDGFFTS